MNKNQVEKVIWWALKNLLGNLGSHAGRGLLCLPEIDTYCAFRLA